MTTTLHTIGTTIAAQVRFLPTLAHMLCDDIDASTFADRLGTTINHPAFVLGHIAYFSGVSIEVFGGKVAFNEGEVELYQVGATCLDDATKYPDKDRCLAHFEARSEMAAAYLEACDPELFGRSSKGAPFEEHYDTLGEVVSFMLIGHPPFHLGQISAWRRIAGMGSAT